MRWPASTPTAASPLKAIQRIDIPVLLIHGEDDNLIPMQHAMRLYTAANRENVRLLRVRSADHTTLGGTTVEPVRIAAHAWFNRHLKADESDPGQAAAGRDNGTVRYP